MRIEYLLGTLTAVALVAACGKKSPTGETESPEAEAQVLQSITIIQAHPWAGRTVKIRDYNHDAYNRCMGADSLPAANVGISAQLCLNLSGTDSLQLFTVVGFPTNPLMPFRDPSRVALRSVYDPRFCIDVEWGTATGGERIQLYPCHYGDNQLFHIPVPAPSATGAILTKNSNYLMAFEADAPNSSGAVKPIWQRTYSASQHYQEWTLQLQ